MSDNTFTCRSSNPASDAERFNNSLDDDKVDLLPPRPRPPPPRRDIDSFFLFLLLYVCLLLSVVVPVVDGSKNGMDKSFVWVGYCMTETVYVQT